VNPAPRRVRSLWISDVHLGTKGSKVEALKAFLQAHKADYLYLVGDIVDGWALRKSWYWDAAHNELIRILLKAVRDGTQVRLLCGNHDEFLRSWIGHEFGGIRILEECEHRTADGRRILILHGDRFDFVVRSAPWLAHLGDWAYRMLLVVNTGFNFVRRRIGLPYWSLSLFLKQKVKAAVAYGHSFENAIVREAKERGFNGVVCGHIHKPEIRELEGTLYLNSGDWVESCTAIVEELDGRLRLERWPLTEAPVAAKTQPAVTSEPSIRSRPSRRPSIRRSSLSSRVPRKSRRP
jgi:UDP-2,3-diacylglucosamine pyrophosphatase LpxH